MSSKWISLVLVAFTLSFAPAFAADTPAASREFDFLMARLAANEGDFDRALRLIDQVLAADPGDPILIYERASIMADAQQLERAETELKKLVERYPDFYDANRLLGRLILDRSGGSPARIEQSLRYLRAAYRIMPDDLASGLTVAQILVALERFDEAAAVLATVVERAPDNRTANYSYAQVLTRLGRSAEATAFLERANLADPTFAPVVFQLLDIYQKGREWGKAASILEPLVAEDSVNPDLRRQLGFFLLRSGRADEARGIFQSLLASDSRDERSRFFLAESLAETRKFSEAEKLYREILQYDPYNVDALVSFGLVQMATRDFDGAADTFKILLGIESASDPVKRLARTQIAAIQHNRGDYGRALDEAVSAAVGSERLNQQAANIALDVYRRQERWDEGISLLQRLIDAHGEDRYLLARRLEFLLRSGRQDEVNAVVRTLEEAEGGRQTVAEVYLQTEQYPRAVGIYQELREENPKDIPTLFQLGAALERSGSPEEAEKVFRELLAIEPAHAPTLNYLGYMWADRGVNLEDASEMIGRAVEIDPDNGAYLDSLGWVYFRQGKLDLAEKYLTEAAEIIPDDPTIQEHLGDLYAEIGKRDEALTFYRKALDLDPEDEEERGIRGKIAELERRAAP